MKIQSMLVSLAVVTATTLAVAACQPAASTKASPPATSSADEAAVATKPDPEKEKKHLREHVTYPATRAQILAACADTPEFTAGERKWCAQSLPDRTYASADEVISALPL
jgi:hypothetical protein